MTFVRHVVSPALGSGLSEKDPALSQASSSALFDGSRVPLGTGTIWSSDLEEGVTSTRAFAADDMSEVALTALGDEFHDVESCAPELPTPAMYHTVERGPESTVYVPEERTEPLKRPASMRGVVGSS